MLKPVVFTIPADQINSIRIQTDEAPHFYDKMHFHQEYQITAIIKGRGVLYGGHEISGFEEGDIWMLGSNVPHIFRCQSEYYGPNSAGVHSISVFFSKKSLGTIFFDLPEMNRITKLLDISKRILKLTSHRELFGLITQMPLQKDHHKLISFLNILSQIESSPYLTINPDTYELSTTNRVNDRINDIFSYTYSHLSETIDIETIAAISNLSRSQFSRYFKTHTGKTYIQFLNELRIEKACQKLLFADLNIDQIAFDVGYQNISHFNRVFKSIRGQSPNEYRKQKLH